MEIKPIVGAVYHNEDPHLSIRVVKIGKEGIYMEWLDDVHFSGNPFDLSGFKSLTEGTRVEIPKQTTLKWIKENLPR